MRYSDTHKQETRTKVLRAAAAAVRVKGPDGISVADIMAEAGLTHGGFYAHFPTKEALVAAAVAEAFDQGRRRFARVTAGLDGPEALGAHIDAYVTMEHRGSPARGCPAPALASDLPRQGAAVRAAFEAGLQGLIASLARHLPIPDGSERQDLAGSLVAEMAGAVTLSRSLTDDAAAARFLDQSRRRIRDRAGVPDAPRASAAPCAEAVLEASRGHATGSGKTAASRAGRGHGGVIEGSKRRFCTPKATSCVSLGDAGRIALLG